MGIFGHAITVYDDIIKHLERARDEALKSLNAGHPAVALLLERLEAALEAARQGRAVAF